MAVSLPSFIRIDVGEAVTLELETDRPYVENPQHIKQVKYKGKRRTQAQGSEVETIAGTSHKNFISSGREETDLWE